jgi:hypothetical protein
MYWAHFMSVHDISEIRSSTCEGVRAPASRVINAETGMRHSANRMYDGARNMLATNSRNVESAGVKRTTALHMNTAGAIAMPQTIAWANTMETAVTPMRETFIALHHGRA